jgi:hypothetical protein
MSFPGYPTVAAAGLYLCLSAGCGSGTSESQKPPFPQEGGTAPTTFDASPPDTEPMPPLAGGPAQPFDALPEADAEAVASPDLALPDADPNPFPGPLTGGAPPPYETGESEP